MQNFIKHAYQRIGFYFEDYAKSHLVSAQSHLSNVENKLGKLLSGKRRSLLYKRETDAPLNELRDGIRKKIIPSIRQKENLKQIQEAVGQLALIFIEVPPRFIRIREYNERLKKIPEIERENLQVKILLIWNSWLKAPLIAFLFSFGVLAGISAIIHPNGLAYIQDKIAEILGEAVAFAGILLAGKKYTTEKRIPVKK